MNKFKNYIKEVFLILAITLLFSGASSLLFSQFTFFEWCIIYMFLGFVKFFFKAIDDILT